MIFLLQLLLVKPKFTYKISHITLLDQFIKFLVKLLTSSELVSLFMATIKILSDTDKIQNILMYFASSNDVKT